MPKVQDDNILTVEKVSKKYCKTLKRSMLYGVKDIIWNIFGQSTNSGTLRKDEFFGVNDLSFELKRGKVLGVIGPNGSGKTTLLKMLNGIFWPDKGKITISGNVGALIEVGAGFHPILTGRENIYLNSAILGMSKEEVDAAFDDIVNFADIGDFLDVPVKHYSSGMFVRLGFAVAVHSKPDILLVDEVLAVGDAAFRTKCYRKIGELLEDCAVVIVSHDLTIINTLCDKVAVMDEGKMSYFGEPAQAINFYRNNVLELKRTMSGGLEVWDEDIKVHDISLDPETIGTGEVVTLRIKYNSNEDIPLGLIRCNLKTESELMVAEYDSRNVEKDEMILKGDNELVICLGEIPLNEGTYIFSLAIYDRSNKKTIIHGYDFIKLNIKGWHFTNATVPLLGKSS